MAQRMKTCPNSSNLESAPCEKFISRFLSKEKPPTVQRCRDKIPKSNTNQNQLSKMKPNMKQQNVASPKYSQCPNNLFQYSDDSTLVNEPPRATNLRHRSRSTTVDREPWGQLLKQQKSGEEKISVFGNFDPLRTLHFLAKELKYQIQAVLPDDSTVQQLISDIQYALKRVPPEVASTVHLQQALDSFPGSKKSSKTDCEVNKKSISTQTPPYKNTEDNEKLNKFMQESTLKFDMSFKQLENLCTELRSERDYIARQLETERSNVAQLRKRIHDLEIENMNILGPRLKALEDEKQKLELNFAETAKNLETEALATTSDLKAQLAETKNAKMLLDQECNKLKHQLRLSGLERDKYVAVLAIRDKQINEIRNEMTQLQEVVNEQLMQLHNNAHQSMPGGGNTQMPLMAGGEYHNKENIGDIGDSTLSTIYSNDDRAQHIFKRNSEYSFKDLPAGDLDFSALMQQDYPESKHIKNGAGSKKDLSEEKTESQMNIRNMFSEIKKAAYAVTSTPRQRSQFNLLSNT